MKQAFDMVTEFHRVFDRGAPEVPTLEVDIELRNRLLDEEHKEYNDAVEAKDIVAIADALADMCYVIVGTAVAHGLTRFGEMFSEVHVSNMSKLDADGNPIIREDGKIIKGPNYTPPQLEQFL